MVILHKFHSSNSNYIFNVLKLENISIIYNVKSNQVISKI